MLTNLMIGAATFSLNVAANIPISVSTNEWNLASDLNNPLWEEIRKRNKHEKKLPEEDCAFKHESDDHRGMLKSSIHPLDRDVYWNDPNYSFIDENGLTTIPIDFDESYSADDRAWIIRAITHLADRMGCVKFVQRRPDEGRYIGFVGRNESGCWGYGGIMQYELPTKVQLGPYCMTTRTIIHEVVHALGYGHTQQRPDAVDQVEVLYDNIQFGKTASMSPYDPKSAPIPSNKYDCDNVMHYGDDAFAIRSGLKVLVPKTAECAAVLKSGYGQNEMYGWDFEDYLPLEQQLSANDIVGIREMYCPNGVPLVVGTTTSTSTTTSTKNPAPSGGCTNDPSWSDYDCNQKLKEGSYSKCEGEVWWPSAGRVEDLCAGTCSERGIRDCGEFVKMEVGCNDEGDCDGC
eukprot:GHVH01001458.1.p1 GENE.GHVH01001458.1~~GHVH01001458.1.p1  ORF type:complete len:403 (-),score=48.07 GHVH01001458.1:112-1320(-)